MSKIEEAFNRISTHKGVVGIIIINSTGTAIKSTMERDQTIEYSTLISQFLSKARQSLQKALNELATTTDELTFFRLRSKNHEIMIAPDKEYSLIVIQNPNAKS